MTPREILKILDSIELRNSPIPIGTFVLNPRPFGGYLITILITSKDRDTGGDIVVQDSMEIPEHYDAEAVLYTVLNHLEKMWMHEFREFLHVGGVRIRDPHLPRPPQGR